MRSPVELSVDRIEAVAPEAKGGGGGQANWSVRVQVKGRKKPRLAASNLTDKGDTERIARALWQPLWAGAR